jgi:hypothetical protein
VEFIHNALLTLVVVSLPFIAYALYTLVDRMDTLEYRLMIHMKTEDRLENSIELLEEQLHRRVLNLENLYPSVADELFVLNAKTDRVSEDLMESKKDVKFDGAITISSPKAKSKSKVRKIAKRVSR